MVLQKSEVKGKKGETVFYSLPNFRYDELDSKLKWDGFRFYTPAASQLDEDGFRYFNVPADEVLVIREEVNKTLKIFITKDDGVDPVEIYEGEEVDQVKIGLEGDIVATCFIPAGTADIIADYVEITDGSS